MSHIADSWLTSWADAQPSARPVADALEELRQMDPLVALEADPIGTIRAWSRGSRQVAESGNHRPALALLIASGALDPLPVGRPPRGGRRWRL
jgi:hypothetical protein